MPILGKSSSIALCKVTEIVVNKEYIFDIWIELLYAFVPEGSLPNSFTLRLFLVIPRIITTVNQWMHLASNMRKALCLREFQAVCIFGWQLSSLQYQILLSEF
jgi:hypothetical protein